MSTHTGQGDNERSVLQHRFHKGCFICRSAAAEGLGVEFSVLSNGIVEGSFDCSRCYQGYDGMMHGGILSALLDGAMTQCLFARGAAGVTARLIVRFLRPVAVGIPVKVRAWICDDSPPLYVLESELVQQGTVKTRATAKFIDHDLISTGIVPPV